MVLRLFKVIIPGRDISVVLIYLFSPNYYVVLYIYLKEGGVLFTLIINSEVKEGDISNLLIALSVIPYDSSLVRGGDLFTLSAKALT